MNVLLRLLGSGGIREYSTHGFLGRVDRSTALGPWGGRVAEAYLNGRTRTTALVLQ